MRHRSKWLALALALVLTLALTVQAFALTVTWDMLKNGYDYKGTHYSGNAVLFDEKVYLSHHDNGKPYLENSVTNISITHTEKYVAVILNDNEDVGIDCESLDRDFSAVEAKALSEEEIDDLEDDEKRNEQLAIYWCAKEAIFKRLSLFNVDFAEQIELERFRPKGEGELEATFIDEKEDYEQDFDLSYITFDRHVLVWVVGGER